MRNFNLSFKLLLAMLAALPFTGKKGFYVEVMVPFDLLGNGMLVTTTISYM